MYIEEGPLSFHPSGLDVKTSASFAGAGGGGAGGGGPLPLGKAAGGGFRIVSVCSRQAVTWQLDGGTGARIVKVRRAVFIFLPLLLGAVQ
jgi:hypothetical protein